MKKIILVLLLAYLTACQQPTNQTAVTTVSKKCYSTHKEAFDDFVLSLKNKDFANLKVMTESGTNVDFHKIFDKYQNPEIKFLPEEADGAFGIKNTGTATTYFVRVLDDNVKKGELGIMFQKSGDCFKLINIPEVKSSK